MVIARSQCVTTQCHVMMCDPVVVRELHVILLCMALALLYGLAKRGVIV